LRSRADAGGRRRGAGAGDRVGRRRLARASLGRDPHRRRRRGARGEHLPLRRVLGPRGEGAARARRHPGAAVRARARAAAAGQRADARSNAFPREVRIIGGAWKRSKLPVADRPGLRPTPDRVRETIFNWLGQSLEGWRCVDAFAGSGALGFEAASRGAAEVVLLEADAELVRSLRASQGRLKADALRIEVADAIAWMRRAPPGHFDLVLLDPP